MENQIFEAIQQLSKDINTIKQDVKDIKETVKRIEENEPEEVATSSGSFSSIRLTVSLISLTSCLIVLISLESCCIASKIWFSIPLTSNKPTF